MFQDKSLNLLKNIVILMGIVLIIGVLTLFKMIATKISDSENKTCNHQKIKLDPDNIKNITADNGKIFLHITDEKEEKIIFFDYCNSKEINNITLF